MTTGLPRLTNKRSSRVDVEDPVAAGSKSKVDPRLNGNESECQCSESEHLRDNEMSYKSVAIIQIGEVIGSGILTLPGAFAKLGWFLGILLLVVFAGLAMFVGKLLTEAKMRHPQVESFAELVKEAYHSSCLAYATHILFIVYTILSAAGYLVGATQAMAMLFFDTSFCSPIWGMIIVAFMVFVVQVRNFSDARIITYVNMVLILFAVFASAIYMLVNMDSYHAEASPAIVTSIWPPPGLTWRDILGALSQIVFAYSGAFFYLEMMREMKRPQDFPKSIALSVPFQLLVYIFIASIGYAYGGESSHDMVTKYIDPISSPGLFRAASACLMLHLCVSYLLFATPVARTLNKDFFPSTLDKRGMRARLVWAGVSISLLIVAYLLSNIIPLFGSICAISGSLFAPILNMGIPAFCFLALRRTASVSPSAFEWFGVAILIFITVCLTPVGTVANIIQFVDDMHTQDTGIFECTKESYLDSLAL